MSRERLEFSQDALLNRTLFYEGLNDINLYVEDADSQYIYETIFKRLLGDSYKIQTIFPCGGKQGVVQAYEEYGPRSQQGIKNVYLVDGDFDRLIDPESMVSDPQFVYLKRYNIESYLINKRGVHKFAKGTLRCVDAEVDRQLRYEEWKKRIVSEAKDLFLCYCGIQKLGLGIPNVNREHHLFIDPKTGFRRTDGVVERDRRQLFSSHPEMSGAIETIRSDFERIYDDCYECLICGKFLISSLHDYLYTILHRKINKRDLVWVLVETFDVEQLYYVREVCLSTASPTVG